MTTLILLLPPRSRLRAQGRDTPAPAVPARADGAAEYDYVLSHDGQQPATQGRSSLSALPKADSLVLMPAEADVAWQRLDLPRAGRQLREALAGVLEEQLLDDPEQLAFAVQPQAVPGEPAWVAVCSKAHLQQHLLALEQAQLTADRVLPQSWPEAEARGHFFAESGSERLGLRLSHTEGVLTLSLDGSLARELLAADLRQSTRWSAEPAVVEAAERWLDAPVAPQTAAERAVAALRSPWELRQFEMAARTRGLQALRQFWRQLMGPAWRPLRWGLAGLLLVQLLGLNLWAWQQRQAVEQRRAALNQILADTHPQVRAVLDAPLQMRRETELLRASAGRAGDQDLEVLLAAAASAWPPERGPIEALSFETGRLQLAATGWNPQQIEQFRRQLGSEGWQLDATDGRLAISRARQP